MNKKIKEYLELSLFFLKTYLLMIVSMFSIRIYFVFKNKEYIKESIPFKTFSEGLFIGWVYDNAVICYIFMVVILSFLLYFVLNKFNYRKLAKILGLLPFLILIIFVYFIGIYDVVYFKEFGFHLNSSINDYATNTSEIISTLLSKQYSPFTNLSFFFGLTGLNVYFINKFINTYEKMKNESFKIHITNFILALCLITLGVFGTRGSFASSTLNWGKAYYSKYEFANQMTLNGSFSFGKSYYYQLKKEKIGAIPKTFSLDEASKIVTESIFNSNEKTLNGKNPLLKEVTNTKAEKKSNVVLIVLESWASHSIGALNAEKDLTPSFDKIAKEGVLFTDFYAVGGRSNRGIASVNISYPSPLDEAVTKDVIASQVSFVSIANILKTRGYNTHFVYGGDSHFDNMDGFLRKNGIDNIVGIHDFPYKDRTIKWGVPDDKLFQFGIKYMDKLKEPFFVNYFTLSNHPPYDMDPNYKFTTTDVNDEMYLRDKGYSFSDYALGQFIENVKKTKYAQNTVFLFVADHGSTLKKFKVNDHRFFQVPLLIWSPNQALLTPQRISKVGSQIDILPTLMDVLGGNYKSAAWGQDLLVDNKKNYAFVSNGDSYGIVDDKYFYYHSKMEGKKLVDKFTLAEVDNPELKKEYNRLLNGHIDLLNYQREQGLFGDK